MSPILRRERVSWSLLITAAIALVGCGPGTEGASPPIAASPVASPAANPDTRQPHGGDGHSHHGGQVVEVGPYHLELVMVQEEKGAHVDLFLLQAGDDHTPIPTATVTAQIQDPNGNERELPLPYDAAGKHYAATLPDAPSGNYQVRIRAQMGDDAPTARFSVDF
ncbi:MAG: hypothetical protein MH825_00125 [Cyanobacteria bacterium]|nr:hypothetical protein [Cyanobacteriota bacterium]